MLWKPDWNCSSWPDESGGCTGKKRLKKLYKPEEMAKDVEPKLAVKTKTRIYNREWIEAIQIKNIIRSCSW